MTIASTLLLTASFLAWGIGPARAQPAAPGAAPAPPATTAAPEKLVFERLTPASPNPALSAKPLTDACIEINANHKQLEERFKGKCEAFATVSQFCGNPLIAKDVPTSADARQLADGTCPKPIEALGVVEQKSLAPGMLGASWQDVVLRGLAAFVVSRAEEEVVLSVADNVRTKVCQDPAGKALFPTTCLMLSDDPYESPPSWSALRAAAEEDLRNLPLTALEQLLPGAKPDPGYAVLVATDISEQVLLFGRPLLPYLYALDGRFASDATTQNPYRASLYAVGVAAEIVGPGLSSYKTDEARSTFLAVSARKLWGVLAQKQLLSSVKDQAAALVRVVGDIQSAVDQMAAIAKQRTVGVAPGGDALIAYALTLSQALGAGERLGLMNSKLQISVARIASLATNAMEAVVTRDYPKAFTQTISLLHTVNLSLPAGVVRYGPMLAELAAAKDADSAEKAIRAGAAPAGSWRAKRQPGKLTYAVNGYVGLQGGSEWLGSSNLPRAQSWTGGLYAPVGFEGTLGLGERGGSLGLFFSVVDIGALLNFRTTDNDTTYTSETTTVSVEQSPAYNFSQVFSPGLFARYGLGCFPLVFGFGASITPELRRVTIVDTQTKDSVAAFHVGGFVAIDLTLFPF